MRTGAIRRGDDITDKARQCLDRHPRTAMLVMVIRRVVRSQGQERTSLAAAGSAFWIFLAVFPAAITVVTIFGLVVDPGQIASALDNLTHLLPGTVGQVLEEQLQAIAATDRTSLSIGLVISVIVSLWSTSGAAYSLGRGIQQSYGLPPRNYIVARTRSFIAGFVGVVALALIAFALTVTKKLGNDYDSHWQGTVIDIGKALVGLAVIIALIVGVYRFGIGGKTGLAPLLPGAVIATIGVVAMGFGFGVFLSHWGNYTAIYGAAAGIAIALILAYLSMYIILLGAIFNAQLDRS